MSYQQKNVIASLVSTLLIVIFYIVRMFTIISTAGWDEGLIFRLWYWIIGLTIGITILLTIAMHITSAVVQAVKDPTEEPDVDSTEDERDQNIKMKGTNVAYIVSSMCVVSAMLSFVLGANSLVMFNILIVSGFLSSIGADLTKLVLYKRGY